MKNCSHEKIPQKIAHIGIYRVSNFECGFSYVLNFRVGFNYRTIIQHGVIDNLLRDIGRQ